MYSAQTHPHYRADAWLLATTFVLLGISILMVFSTTALASHELYGDSTSMIKRHLASIFAGLVVFGISSRLNPRGLQRLAVPMLIASLLMLILVCIPHIGHIAGGARRWLVLGPLRVQPGEICKVFLIIYFAAYIERYKAQMANFVPGALIPFATLGLFAGLLLLEPDFGTTAVILIVVLCQLFTVARMSHLFYIGTVAVVSGALLVFSSPYRWKRMTAFRDPFNDPTSSGYQLIQSLIAVGSGGMYGEGLGAGQQKLFYLPAAHTDFIFAVIAEELGLVGALFVLLLFIIVLYRGITISKRLSDHPFLCSLALGCTLLIVMPAVLNISVVLGLLPTKGMVLPLVAYGGTAMVVHLGAMGTLLQLSRIEP